MNYKVCEDCDQKYCGWAKNLICQKCGGRLLEISWKEFYLDKYSDKEVITKGDK